jgi:hypothetical protein
MGAKAHPADGAYFLARGRLVPYGVTTGQLFYHFRRGILIITVRQWFRMMRAADFNQNPERLITVQDFVWYGRWPFPHPLSPEMQAKVDLVKGLMDRALEAWGA